ncbi:CAI-1 autoinducer synthase [Collimonas sp. PA-H2]|uniref:alpha-hydroxyketone-type quorum-sensing autoinducer synthase n=1 Tax=Collimonas sp. PA-H2 TaxID=1881062 RepID=UPI000BF7B018|nr:alpha-hydroxyketone-type quorum-sensing autoinducer synthase [Collimonas sp. PA-H2]PFH09865.1 CAI-1 autoinducer synthase [Collimonas sp. PA-H2]
MPLTESYHEPLVLAAEQRLPAFVSTRLDEYYIDRVEKLWGGEHILHWSPSGPNAIYLSSNDYLCIAAEAQLIKAQVACLMRGEADLLMSTVFMREGSAQPRLEKKLAAFMGAEDGLITQSGWSANVGLLQTIAAPGVAVYLDMQAHASLWEGVHAAQARPVPFLHNDIEHLRRQVLKHGAGVIVVDAVYSTSGSVCPLEEVLAIAEDSGSILVVDESHSLGTHGPEGAGLVMQMGLSERVHFRTASLAKAFGGRAGFITCSSKFKGYFLSTSRPAIFSSCMLGHELAWFDAALDFIRHADDRRLALHRNARVVRDGLSALGYNVSDGSEQIIALEAGTEPKTQILRKALEAEGIFGAVFCAPATPKNRSLVRLTLNSGLTEVEIRQILQACAAIREKVDLAGWSSSRRLAAAAISR